MRAAEPLRELCVRGAVSFPVRRKGRGLFLGIVPSLS